ncbi:MAG: chorismate mutase, partial [Candidatus Parcubacteria bacterium]|nr:chorismate mutase [Candidatus Parcubacteria bacterium]
LAKRFSVTRKVGEYKKKNNLNTFDPKREEDVFNKRIKWAKNMGLDPELIKNIFEIVINKVKKKHKEILNEKKYK